VAAGAPNIEPDAKPAAIIATLLMVFIGLGPLNVCGSIYASAAAKATKAGSVFDRRYSRKAARCCNFGAGCKLIYPLRHRRSWQSVSGKILLRLGPRCGEPSASNPN